MRAAFVVQRYGEEIIGGAEYLCRQVAEHMTRHWDVEVITTCAHSYLTWRNEYPQGDEALNGVRVRRFRVDAPRDPNRFNALSRRVLPGHPHSRDDELQWMRSQGPYSSGLLRFLERQHYRYDVFLFYTYLYCTSYFGIPLVADRAVLVPTAHDELWLGVRLFQEVFHQPQGLIFLTPEEQALVHQRFRNGSIPSAVAALGMEAAAGADPRRFRDRYQVPDPFILYVGRVDESKGCKELIESFLRRGGHHDIRLVLIGPTFMQVPKDPRVIALGAVSEEDKRDALAATELLVQPSRFESLSIVVLEAWLAGTPVLVNGACEVLKGQCRRAQGGLWYHNEDEFGAALDHLLSHPELRLRLAHNGRRYVEANYSWQTIEDKYCEFVAEVLAQARSKQ